MRFGQRRIDGAAWEACLGHLLGALSFQPRWPPVHLISFTVMPKELRISFVACVSFVWLIYLSYASHKESDIERAEAPGRHA